MIGTRRGRKMCDEVLEKLWLKSGSDVNGDHVIISPSLCLSVVSPVEYRQPSIQQFFS